MSGVSDNPCWTIPKSAHEEVRVELTHWKGADRLNVRVWVRKDDGVMIATKFGFTLALDRCESFSDAVASAVCVARERGLIV